MTEQTQSITGTAQPPTTAPRTIDAATMRGHEAAGHAVPLARFDRYHMFVRYDDTWWIAYGDTYFEITETEQAAQLDRWHRRVTKGALWD